MCRYLSFFILLIATTASTHTPIPRVGDDCPTQTYRSGAFTRGDQHPLGPPIRKARLGEARSDSLPELDHAGPDGVVRLTGMKVMPKRLDETRLGHATIGLVGRTRSRHGRPSDARPRGQRS